MPNHESNPTAPPNIYYLPEMVVEADPLPAPPSEIPPEQQPLPPRTTTNSYSGADIRVLINTPDKVHMLGNLQTISYSIHRDKMPVRTLGRTYPKSFVRGPRTVAGSLIFTIFDRHALWDILQYHARDLPESTGYTPLSDMLPPFDTTIVFDNEYGAQAVMRIYGMEIVDEGQTMSIEDMITENSMSYIARNIELMSTSRTDAFGPEGKVLANRGVFIKGNVPDSVIDEIGAILDNLALYRLELAGGLYGNDIPNGAREAELRTEIEYLEEALKSDEFTKHLRIQGKSTSEDVNRYNIPWDFRTRRQVKRGSLRTQKTTNTGAVRYNDYKETAWEIHTQL